MLARNKASNEDRHLSPTEAARRLGVTVKALRLYERHGLVKPVRTAAAWRTYGPAEIARLHQVLALQEQTLTGEGERITRALALIRAAKVKLAAGEALSIDDLTTLTKETTMAGKATPEDMKEIFAPLTAKYFTKEEEKALIARKNPNMPDGDNWEKVTIDLKAVMAKGDPTSPAALALARRWRALVNQFTGGDQAIAGKVRAMWNEALADPKAAPRLPLNQEMFAFMAKAGAKLKEIEG